MKKISSIEVGKRLVKIRNQYGYKQKIMSVILDIHVMTLCRAETGSNLPSIDTLSHLANKFNVSLDWLFWGEGTMFRNQEGNSKLKNLDSFDHETNEMIGLMKNFPLLKHSVMSHYENFKLEHKDLLGQSFHK